MVPVAIDSAWERSGCPQKAQPGNGVKTRGSVRKAKVRARPLEDFDTERFLTTVGAGRTISTYRAKTYIFRQGTKCDAVYYLQQGRIELSVVSSEGKERVVGLLGPGSFVGERVSGRPAGLYGVGPRLYGRHPHPGRGGDDDPDHPRPS